MSHISKTLFNIVKNLNFIDLLKPIITTSSYLEEQLGEGFSKTIDYE